MLAHLDALLLLPLMTCLFRSKIEILCRWIRSSSTLRELRCVSFTLGSLQTSLQGALVSELFTDNRAVPLIVDSGSMKHCSLQFCGWFISNWCPCLIDYFATLKISIITRFPDSIRRFLTWSWVLRGACWLVPPVSLGLKCHLCVGLPVYHVLIMVIIRCFGPLVACVAGDMANAKLSFGGGSTRLRRLLVITLFRVRLQYRQLRRLGLWAMSSL